MISDTKTKGGHGRTTDKEIELLIERRHNERVKAEGERREEELWQESVRRHNARRAAESRLRWLEYHRDSANRHRAVLVSLIEEHEREAAKYEAQMIDDGKRKEHSHGN